ncbi:hypothetical protein GQ44DRAFT_788927 [Phaeosphaeriaceae sp. PMI808]|nr:hypothetical protein GQ44DRAFT_788927 [Phaeosphaeriaceae sp. PMI808]
MAGWRTSTATLILATSALLAIGLAQITTSEGASTMPSVSANSQSTIPVPSMTRTTSASEKPRVHMVRVGAGGFHFEPNELKNVSIGDIVTFEFYPPDHSVARAEYESACVPYEYTGRNKIGFWSETQWVETASEITHWNLTINNTEPVFYYCAAPNSCIGKRMVGAINPNSTQTLDAQIRAVAKAEFQLAPGESVPKEASSTLVVAPAATSREASTSVNHHPPRLSTATIVGIVFGGIAFITLCAIILVYVARKTRTGHKKAPTEPMPNTASICPTSPGVGDCPPPFSPCTSILPNGYPYSLHEQRRRFNTYDALSPSTPQSPAVELEAGKY